MLPPLQPVDPKSVGARLGGLINSIRDRLYAQTLISSASIKVTDTDRGQQLDRVGVAGSGGFSLGFAVTHTGGAVQVAPGRVITQSWSGTSGSNFRPSEWDTESNFTGAVLASSVTSVWLQIQFTEDDTESEGALATTNIDLSGGAGGRGGGGSGGGASGGDNATTEPLQAEQGGDGLTGGLGGDGAIVVDDPGGTPLTGTGLGHGADGGAGGAGGDGGDGTTETFTRPTKSVVQVRHYTLSGISAHSSQGTPGPTSTWLRLATLSAGVVIQHHIGAIMLSPAVTTFVEP